MKTLGYSLGSHLPIYRSGLCRTSWAGHNCKVLWREERYTVLERLHTHTHMNEKKIQRQLVYVAYIFINSITLLSGYWSPQYQIIRVIDKLIQICHFNTLHFESWTLVSSGRKTFTLQAQSDPHCIVVTEFRQLKGPCLVCRLTVLTCQTNKGNSLSKNVSSWLPCSYRETNTSLRCDASVHLTFQISWRCIRIWRSLPSLFRLRPILFYTKSVQNCQVR